MRQALNNWIRTSGSFDGVIDFASSVADKADPLKIAPSYNDGDKLHPNDADTTQWQTRLIFDHSLGT